MAAKSFNASKYLTDLNGRDYLEVKWRLLWLRTEHPDAAIETELIKHEGEMALFRAKVLLLEGGEATGWGSETADDFGDYIEKAETKALGRALAALGYGTQFCEDFDFAAETKRSKRDLRVHGAKQTTSNGHMTNDDRSRVVDAPVNGCSLKVVRDRGGVAATSAQVKAIYAIARDLPTLGTDGVEENCREKYGCLPSELSKRQASELIDLLRRNGASASANPDREKAAQPV